ncbi:outer membrane lipoprotein-sorting protein [Spirochaetia bacterium 38H-sp]|uniref:Outer membrane lipoprotein-sorting protein n=1 Tax=Rarispira pelagica TaxID=3141764 RepID=A0ABU9UBK1_9SPIR
MIKKKTAITALIFAVTINLFALDGREIMQKAEDSVKVDSTHALVQMSLTDKNNKESVRILEMFEAKDKNGLSQSLIIFHKPASVAGTRFLVQEQKGRSDDKFIYLPSLKRVRRIAASEGGQSFMGSDFSYDDMSTRDIDEDTHTLLREEKYNGQDCYVVQSIPKNLKEAQYQLRISWVRKDNFMPVRVELYETKDRLKKVLTIEKLEKIDGVWTPIITKMENITDKHSTTLTMQKVEYNKKLPDALFTQKFLETGRL